MSATSSANLVENGMAKSSVIKSEPVDITDGANEPIASNITPLEAHNESPEGTTDGAATSTEKKWPGWPGDCVFRLIVPVIKVGSIIGRKGELIKKICEDTRARIRVLDGAAGTPDRVVLISGKEEPQLPLSPAMNAVIKVFKRIVGLSEFDADEKSSGADVEGFCSTRMLVASTQAISLIGKQGSVIKSIQESSGASVRVLSGDDVPFYLTASDERIIEIQGETLKVLKALEAVVGHLRKYLVDRTVLPLFEKNQTVPVLQDHQPSATDNLSLHTSKTAVGSDYPLPLHRESLFSDLENARDSLPPSGFPVYGQDHLLSGLRSSGIGRADIPLVTQVTKTMQVPLVYAENIIGTGGANINYIRRTSNAVMTVQESQMSADEIIIDIKGTPSQVQIAQQLIQEFIDNYGDVPVQGSGYGNMEGGLRAAFPPQGHVSSYPTSSLSSQPFDGYGNSGLGKYSGGFRL